MGYEGTMSNADSAGVPVQWLLAQRNLGLTLLTGDVAADRHLTWAHSIELADPSPWLRGGELVLTTGLRLPADPAGQQGYVESIARAGAAAIGFGVGLSHQLVPPAVITAATELELPVLEVPLPTPFIAVVRTVTERLAELQYDGFVRAARVQPRMARAALRRGLGGLLNELATALDGEAAMVDRDGRLLSGTLPTASTSAALEALQARFDSDRFSSAVCSSSDGVVSAQSVRVGRRVHGHLVVATPAPLTPADHFLVGHAASLIALEQEKPLRLRNEQARIKTLVLSLLLDGALAPSDAARRLSTIDFPAEADMAVLALDGTAPRTALAVVDEVMLDRGLPHIGLERGQSAVAVVPGTLPDMVHGLADEIVNRLGDTGTGLGHTVVTSADELAAGIDRAMGAARAARVRGLPIIDASALGGRLLTTDPASRPALSRVADALLRPLVEHDHRAGTDLVATLRAFLEHHGHVESTAAFLHIHRHTLRARMTRIQNTIDADLDSAYVRAELLLALTVGDETADQLHTADPSRAGVRRSPMG
jgi:purine catabolism regulator